MLSEMKRVNAIWNHPLYQEQLHKLQELEADRIFCRHTPEHFLDVARLAWIYRLERGMKYSRELIYCAALLHDIGRAEQYLNGIPHDEAGARVADIILSDLAFSDAEKNLIITAISEHRTSQAQTDGLSKLLYEADKKSRNCFVCPALEECNWAPEKKNMTIQY